MYNYVYRLPSTVLCLPSTVNSWNSSKKSESVASATPSKLRVRRATRL